MSTNAMCAPACEMASVVAMNVCGIHARCQEGKPQRVCSAVDTDAVFRIAKKCEFALKFFDHGATNEAGGLERFFCHREQLRFELLMWAGKVQERDFHCACHGNYFFSSGMNRRNLAGFPATIA